MRTTVTLDPDVEALVKHVMANRGIGFKAAINHAIRSGLGGSGKAPYRLKARNLGAPRVPIERALRLAAQLEDEEIAAKMELRK